MNEITRNMENAGSTCIYVTGQPTPFSFRKRDIQYLVKKRKEISGQQRIKRRGRARDEMRINHLIN